MGCTPFRHFLLSCFGLLARDQCHRMLRRLIASSASAERTRYCVVGSSRGGMFQCNFSAERVRREAAEWSDKGSWPLV